MKILRFLTASIGGYILAALMSVSLTIIFTFTTTIESIMLANMLSYMIWLLFILYAFSDVNLKKILIQLLVVCFVLYGFNTYFLSVEGV
ncbi:MAG: hypothetical protein WA945_00160 [Arcobacteraceae bacterium]